MVRRSGLPILFSFVAACTGSAGSWDHGSGGPEGPYLPPPSRHGSADAGSSSALPDPQEPQLPPTDEELPPTNPFVRVDHDPFSTFAADVDTASYDIFDQSVRLYETLPHRAAVRIEEFVNYFDYDYPTPAADAADPFEIALEAAAHPMGRDLALLRVGIQAKAAPAREKRPASLVFLVDVSGSMNRPEKLPLVQTLLRATLEELDPTDRIAIVTYAGAVRVALESTPVSEATTIRDAISSLMSGGSTNGAGGLHLAYEQAEANWIDGGINHVLLCTDGDFNVGVSDTESLVELIEEKRRTGVTLTALGFGAHSNDAMMEAVSNAGNGIYSVIVDEAHARRYVAEDILNTFVQVAKDMKIQVEFNPEHVVAYRLLGYENRAIADEDFRVDTVDAGEVGAEHRVTALYELVLAGHEVPAPAGAPALEAGARVEGVAEIGAGELVAVKVRYKRPGAAEDAAADEVRRALLPEEVLGASHPPSLDFTWAAAVAAYAEILKGSPFVADGDEAWVERIVRPQAARDRDRAHFVELFDLAEALR